MAIDSLPSLLEDILNKDADVNTILDFLQEFLDFVSIEYETFYIPQGDDTANHQYQSLAAHLTRMHCLTQNQSYLERYIAILHGILDTMVPERDEAIAVQDRYQKLLNLAQLQQIYQSSNTQEFTQACMQYFNDAIAEMQKGLADSYATRWQLGSSEQNV